MSEYFSKVTCAGGCGNLMPQHLVNRGWAYLYGHKTGCPAEGEPVGKKAVTVKTVREAAASKPGTVVHTSYERTLAMTLENLEAAKRERESSALALQSAVGRELTAAMRYGEVENLVRALMAVVPRETIEYQRAAELLSSSAEPEDAAVAP